MRRPKGECNLKFKIAYYACLFVCTSATIGFISLCLIKYALNDDVSQVTFQEFHRNEESLYPSITICLSSILYKEKLYKTSRTPSSNLIIQFLFQRQIIVPKSQKNKFSLAYIVHLDHNPMSPQPLRSISSLQRTQMPLYAQISTYYEQCNIPLPVSNTTRRAHILIKLIVQNFQGARIWQTKKLKKKEEKEKKKGWGRRKKGIN